MRRSRTVLIPILVFMVVLAVVTGGWWLERMRERAKTEAEFYTLSRQVTIRVRDFMDTRVRIVKHLALDLASQTDIRGTYERIVPGLVEAFPGYQALNLVDEHGVIVAVCPKMENAPALQHDLTTSRRSGPLYTTMVRTRRPVLSGVVPMFDGGTGCSLFVPVVRDSRLVATMLAVFDAHDVVRACLTDGILDRLALDIQVSGKTLFSSVPEGWDAGDHLCSTSAVPVVDRNWAFRICRRTGSLSLFPERVLVMLGAVLVAFIAAFLSRKYLLEHEIVRQSEARLSALLAAAPDVMLVIHSEGKVVDLHAPAECDWFPKATSQRGREMALDKFLPAALEEWVRMRMRGCLDTLLPLRTEGTVAGASGPVTVEAVLSPYDHTHVLLTLRDITARKQAEQRLRESEQQLRTIFESSQDAIFMTSLDGRILAMNPAGVALFRAPSPEALRRVPVSELYEDADERDHLIETLSNQGIVSNWEVRLKRLDGSTFPAMVSTRKLTTADGMACLIGTLKDLSEVKELQAQLIQAQKMESIGRLAGGIAHDFNNILSSVLGYATLMKSKMSPGHPFYRYVETIERGAVRAGELTAQLLGFARKGQYDLVPVDVNRLVDDTVKLLSSTIEKNIKIESRQEPDLPPVNGDLSQLHQVIMNLCVNARDAMPNGGTLTIETARMTEEEGHAVKPALQGAYVRLTVRDTGVGMPPEVKAHIFEPFFTTKEKGKGTGLGLSMVYGVIHNHGGAIQVFSEPGKGAVFHVYLPVMPQETGIVAEDEDSADFSDESGAGEGHTILFADDEADNRSLAQEILEFAGYRVLLAEDGQQALALFQDHARDIDGVILDLMMPNMGGIEALAEIRKLDREVPVLFVSGYAPDDAVKEVMAREHALFIRKPFQLKELLGKVQELVAT